MGHTRHHHVAAGFIKRVNNLARKKNRVEQQPRDRVLSILVALAEQGEHRATAGALPLVGGRPWVQYRDGAQRHGVP